MQATKVWYTAYAHANTRAVLIAKGMHTASLLTMPSRGPVGVSKSSIDESANSCVVGALDALVDIGVRFLTLSFF